MMRICDFKNHYTRCKKGWVYMPDGMGCVQSELCPVCDGEGKIPMNNKAKYNRKYEVLLHVTESRIYKVRAVNKSHAMDVALQKSKKRRKFVGASAIKAKMVGLK